MTTPSPSAADPVGELTPAQHAQALTTVLDSIAGDAARFGLRPVDLSAHLEFGYGTAAVQFDGGNTAAVDALAGSYGLPPAADGTSLYGRDGDVTIDGQLVHVFVYCAPPAGPDPEPNTQAALPAVPQSPAVDVPVPPAVDGGPQPLQVAAVRADTPAVTA